MLEKLKELEDQFGPVKLSREEVLFYYYEEIYETIICGLESNYNKDLILELAEKTLREAKEVLDGYCY